MSDEPNLNVIHLGKETDADKIKALVAEARRLFSSRLPVFELIAKERRAQFSAYRVEGFTAEQALQLIIADIQRVV